MSDSSVSHPSSKSAEIQSSSPEFDMFATGVVTGIIVTTIVETGKGAVGILAKNPLLVFAAGFVTGYFAHKYRKEIILSSRKVTKNTKDFVSRQKTNFVEMISENEENVES